MGDPADEGGELTKETREYLLGECKGLRSEIENLIRQLIDNERTSLIVAGAIWSWLATHEWQRAYTPVLFIPGALSILFFLRWRALESGIFGIAAYLRRVENKLKLQGFGWESHVERAGRGSFGLAHWTFWSVLVAGNIVLAAVYWALQ